MAEQGSNSKAAEYGVLVIGILLMYDKIFGKSKEEEEAARKLEEEQNKLNNQPHKNNPTLQGFKEPPPKKGFLRARNPLSKYTGDGSGVLRKAIGEGIWITNKDASTIVDTIKKYITKSEMNALFSTYSFIYKRDLMTDLRKALDSPNSTPEAREKMQVILNYINNLPDYVKA